MTSLLIFQFTVNLIRLVINLGLEYEDIEGIAIEVCEVLMQIDGYRGDVLCPGMVMNYGPHVSIQQVCMDGTPPPCPLYSRPSLSSLSSFSSLLSYDHTIYSNLTHSID